MSLPMRTSSGCVAGLVFSLSTGLCAIAPGCGAPPRPIDQRSSVVTPPPVDPAHVAAASIPSAGTGWQGSPSQIRELASALATSMVSSPGFARFMRRSGIDARRGSGQLTLTLDSSGGMSGERTSPDEAVRAALETEVAAALLQSGVVVRDGSTRGSRPDQGSEPGDADRLAGSAAKSLGALGLEFRSMDGSGTGEVQADLYVVDANLKTVVVRVSEGRGQSEPAGARQAR